MGKIGKRIGIVLLSVLALLVVVVGGYVLYLQLQYERIEDQLPLEVHANAAQQLEKGISYSSLTYNIGFGAYGPEYTFFMDTGVMADGTKTQGTRGRGVSKAETLANTEGALSVLKAQDADFVLLQEVDVQSHRSWFVDQRETITAALPDYGASFAFNFHSPFLPYPFTDPHGAVQGGLLTLSRYAVDSATRVQLPIDESFPNKFFELDRCFTLQRLPVTGGGELLLINAHLSAYDEGGVSRRAQMETLGRVIADAYAKGDWVIVGGDFNQALGGTLDAFPSGQQIPDWVAALDEALLGEGAVVVNAENNREIPTVRGADIPYTQGLTYCTVVDGFLVTDNVSAVALNVDTGFAYSDHNPVRLEFVLE